MLLELVDAKRREESHLPCAFVSGVSISSLESCAALSCQISILRAIPATISPPSRPGPTTLPRQMSRGRHLAVSGVVRGLKGVRSETASGQSSDCLLLLHYCSWGGTSNPTRHGRSRMGVWRPGSPPPEFRRAMYTSSPWMHRSRVSKCRSASWDLFGVMEAACVTPLTPATRWCHPRPDLDRLVQHSERGRPSTFLENECLPIQVLCVHSLVPRKICPGTARKRLSLRAAVDGDG